MWIFGLPPPPSHPLFGDGESKTGKNGKREKNGKRGKIGKREKNGKRVDTPEWLQKELAREKVVFGENSEKFSDEFSDEFSDSCVG